MPDSLWDMGTSDRSRLSAPLAGALANAAALCGRLDQTLDNHPLRPALLFRARLDAVRRMAAADGQAIDPWHLAAMLEGLRLRMDSELRIVDRGQIFEAARHALKLHRWLVEPDFDQEVEVQRAVAHLEVATDQGGPLLTAGLAFHAWIEQGGGRPAIRTALLRYWQKHGIFSLPLPLTGAASLRSEAPWARAAWIQVFLKSLADEAADTLQLVRTLDHAWRGARVRVAGRRKTSHAAAAIDLLAAAPLLSATSLAAALDIAVKNAARLLDDFCRDGIAIEVTHRAKRRLFALANLAPLRDCVTAPRRPDPMRGRGRPPLMRDDDIEEEVISPPPPPAEPISRAMFDYGDLEVAMARLQDTIRRTRSTLDGLYAAPQA